MHILVLNGPNLNLLGFREPAHYGSVSLDDLTNQLHQAAAGLNIQLSHLQSNAEHVLIDAIHQAMGQVDAIIFNPAAFTHTSIALRDALLATAIPFIEVHISNIYAREAFRHHSYFSDIAIGSITGLGTEGYVYALQFAYQWLQQHKVNHGHTQSQEINRAS